MRAFLLLPGWLLYRVYRPWLPDAHPWKRLVISFEDWVRHATQLNVDLSMGVGFSFILMVALVTKLVWLSW